MRFVRDHPILLGAISLDLFAVLFGGATALLPIFARDILDVGPMGLGVLRSAPAVGSIASALWLASHPLRRHAGRSMFIAVAGFGLATIVFGLSRNLALSLAALAVTGACDMISVYVRQTLVQLGTPDRMRGRVNAVSLVFIGASNELGEFESGFHRRLVRHGNVGRAGRNRHRGRGGAMELAFRGTAARRSARQDLRRAPRAKVPAPRRSAPDRRAARRRRSGAPDPR